MRFSGSTICTSVNEVLDKYKAVFEPGLGTVTGFKAKIIVDSDATPKYCKACSVCPLFLPEEGRKELDKLVEEGMLEPVKHAEWATPIVIVLKHNRVCAFQRLQTSVFAARLS